MTPWLSTVAWSGLLCRSPSILMPHEELPSRAVLLCLLASPAAVSKPALLRCVYCYSQASASHALMGSSACKAHDLPNLYSHASPSTCLYLRWILFPLSLPFYLVGYTSWPTPRTPGGVSSIYGMTWPSFCTQNGFCFLFLLPSPG